MGAFAILGNDALYVIEVTNVGTGAVDLDSLFIIDTLPSEVTFFNGDADGAGPETDPVILDSATNTGLTLSYPTHVAFSDNAVAPISFAACNYSPSAGYDTNVQHICIHPAGSFAAGTPDPWFKATFRVQIQ